MYLKMGFRSTTEKANTKRVEKNSQPKSQELFFGNKVSNNNF